MDLGFLGPATPACICFGPIFMATGALLPLEKKIMKPLCLYGGAIMLVLGLSAVFHEIAHLDRSVEQLQLLLPKK